MRNQGEPAREGIVTVRGLASGFAQTVDTLASALPTSLSLLAAPIQGPRRMICFWPP